MKVLITGGKGYIARNLVPLFISAGYIVDAPSRTEMDLLNYEQVDKYITNSNPDIIIHAAIKGGRRTKIDTWEEVFIPNIKMYENLYAYTMKPGVDHLKIFIIGSGAEFDRRYPIQECSEEIIKYSWPIDPYGLSKNIITRRVLESLNNIWILRLFGCFNWDDDPERFIKNGILNLKNGKPIIIHQNKKMDYFYLDDIFIVIDYIIKTYTNKIIPKNINLVYNKKVTLLDIASLIHKYVGKFKPKIQLNETEEANSYTGSSTILYRLPISSKLIGLEEGIQQTVKKLYE